MLNKDGFNEWSGNYDQSIVDKDGRYPFDGYYKLFGLIESIISRKEQPEVLDLGIGTGTLSLELEKQGALITGVDFSDKMITIAKGKLKTDKLYQRDLRKGLPTKINSKYDYIISTYAFHHQPNDLKMMYLRHLLDYIKPDGEIIIGDISFETAEALELIKKKNRYSWDQEEAEHYFIYNRYKQDLMDDFICRYEQISSCCGMLRIKPKNKL